MGGAGMLVHNNEESDCPAGGMLMITGAHHPAALHGTDYFEGYQPTAANAPNVVIAQAPIAAGYIGICKLDGITIIKTALTDLVGGDGLGSQASSFQAAAGSTYVVFFTESSGTIVYGARKTVYNVEDCV